MTFIEDRPLNRIEMTILIAEAPETEVKNLVKYVEAINEDIFDFLNANSVYRFGLIINKRPIYFAYITGFDGKYELWTVVNSNVQEQFSLYKYSKRSLRKALEEFSPIYATMETHNQKNIDWVKKMGFKEVKKVSNEVTFMIER